MADASFGGVAFSVLYPALPELVALEVTYLHVPGSDVTYGDVGGLREGHRPLPIYCASEADLNALKGLMGTVGTLVCVDGTFPNTMLVKLDAGKRMPDGGRFATAEFVTGLTL